MYIVDSQIHVPHIAVTPPMAGEPVAKATGPGSSPIIRRCAPLSHLCNLLNVSYVDKTELSVTGYYVRHGAGDLIYQVDDPFMGIYIVAAGSAKTTLKYGSAETITGLFLPGEILGFEGIDGGAHTNAGVAVSELLLLWVPYSALIGYCRIYNDLEDAILKAFAQQIFDATVLMEVLARASATVKTAFFVLNLATRMGTYHEPVTELRLTLMRKDIALYVGMAYETFCRHLNGLEEKKLIRCDGNTIHIDDVQGLKEACKPYSGYLANR